MLMVKLYPASFKYPPEVTAKPLERKGTGGRKKKARPALVLQPEDGAPPAKKRRSEKRG